MGFRFRKSVKIAPGVRLNFGKKSSSISFGGKGARFTASSTGRKTVSTGISGTSLSYSTSFGGKKAASKRKKGRKRNMSRRKEEDGEKLHLGRYIALGVAILIAFSMLMQACGITESNTEPDNDPSEVVESVATTESEPKEEESVLEETEEEEPSFVEDIVFHPIEIIEDEPEETSSSEVEDTPAETPVTEIPEVPSTVVESPTLEANPTPESSAVETPAVEPEQVVDPEPVVTPVDDPLSGGVVSTPEYEELEYEDPAYQEPVQTGNDYVINVNSGKYHYAWCDSVGRMAEHNKSYYTGASSDIVAMGYDPCENCNP